MTYSIDDPAHINLGHNELLAAIQEQADRFMVSVTLPDTAGLGDTGHVADHNLIVAALQDIADAPAGPAPATISGTTGSPATGTGLDGKALYTWTGNGSFTVSVAGSVRLLAVCGGAGGSGVTTDGGSGGAVSDVTVWLEPGTYAIVVGAGGAYPGGIGGESTVIRSGYFVLRAHHALSYNLGDGSRSPNSTGINSDITGSSEGFGGAGYNTNGSGYNSSFGGAPNSSAGPRANSGGGGGSANVINGAAGVVKLLI